MHTIYAVLTLKDDTILTSTNKSTEVAPSLSHIPGRQILGCVASRLYADADANDDASIIDKMHATAVQRTKSDCNKKLQSPVPIG